MGVKPVPRVQIPLPPMNKIVFLDIDGVLVTRIEYLNGTKRNRPYKAPWFNKGCVKNLKMILEESKAEIVISSSWRRIYTLEMLHRIFRLNRVPKFIDITPTKQELYRPELGDKSILLSHGRGKEIEQWLKTRCDNVEIINNLSFVILDDDIFDIIEIFPNNTVQTSMEYGLTEEKAQEAIQILRRPDVPSQHKKAI